MIDFDKFAEIREIELQHVLDRFRGNVCRTQRGHQVLLLEQLIVGSQVLARATPCKVYFGIPDEPLEFAVETSELPGHQHVLWLQDHCPSRLLRDTQEHLETIDRADTSLDERGR